MAGSDQIPRVRAQQVEQAARIALAHELHARVHLGLEAQPFAVKRQIDPQGEFRAQAIFHVLAQKFSSTAI